MVKTIEKKYPDIFQNIPSDKREAFIKEISSITIMKSHSGPLPDPNTLKAYNELIPNGADRVMIMAENQQKHRIEIESSVIKDQILQSRRGQIFAFLIGVIGIICGGVVAYSGHDTVGGIIAGTTVVSLVGAFIAGSITQKKS